MAFLASAGFSNAIASIAGIFGIGSSIKSLVSSPARAQSPAPAPEPKPLPPPPKIEDAKKKAEDQVARRRKISLLSGGRTNITRGQSLVSESDVARKSLLGQ